MGTQAIISDIHGNLEALTAVLEDIRKLGISTVHCLGDVIGYGSDGKKCVQRIRKLCPIVVKGNHEHLLLTSSRLDCKLLRYHIGTPINQIRGELTPKEKEWIKELPLTHQLGDVLLVHATPYKPETFTYIYNDEDAKAAFESTTARVTFCGHSHRPEMFEECNGQVMQLPLTENPVKIYSTSRYIINVGSVGQPRDDNPKAAYLVYDPDAQIIWLRRISYDIQKVQEKCKLAGLTHNAERIGKGT